MTTTARYQELRQAIDDEKAARAVLRWLDNERGHRHDVNPFALETLLAGGTIGDVLWQTFSPAARFGKPAVLAAAADPKLVPCCRYGIAKVEAMNLGLPKPPITSAIEILLGKVCSRCLRHERDCLDIRERASRQLAATRSRAAYALTASALSPNFHHANLCGRCNKWLALARLCVRTYKPLPALHPHDPTPPVWRTRTVRANGAVIREFTGRGAACSCKTPPAAACIKNDSSAGPCNCKKCMTARSEAARARLGDSVAAVPGVRR